MSSYARAAVRRGFRVATAFLAGAALTLGIAAPASAAVTVEQKVALLTNLSQPTNASRDAWNAVRANPGAYAEYGLDWSTDFCSGSPDKPSGFDFKNACWRHDFGYRNFKDVNQFPANKARIDNAFYAELKSKCGTYNVFVRPACYGLAWTYYQAVKALGT